LNEFNFWDAVPLDGSATYAEIGEKTGIDESIVRRLLRHSFTNHLFKETEPGSGVVIHTGVSAVAARQPLIRSSISHMLSEVSQGLVNLPAAIRKYGNSPHPAHTAFGYTFYPDGPQDKTFFDFINTDGEGDKKGYRVKRFGDTMAYASSLPSMKLEHMHTGFDWDGLGNGKVVDV
jgi:hypothetical protein